MQDEGRACPAPGREPIIDRRDQNEEQAFRDRLRAGDRAAWEELADEHHAVLLRIAAHILGRQGDAQNAVGDTWFRAWKYAGRYDPAHPPFPWLARICTNECLRQRRRPRFLSTDGEESGDGPIDPSAGPNRRATARDLLRQVLGRLRRRERRAFLLRFACHLSCSEVAQVLGLPESTLRALLSRASRRLRADRKLQGVREWLVVAPGEWS